ncbi:hypothetical protein [Serratia fonticola]
MNSTHSAYPIIRDYLTAFTGYNKQQILNSLPEHIRQAVDKVKIVGDGYPAALQARVGR